MSASPKGAAKPRAKKASKASPDVALVTIYQSEAKRRGVDITRAAKGVRSRLRANFGDVVKADPRIGKVKSAANDGNRWPSHISADVLDVIGVKVTK